MAIFVSVAIAFFFGMLVQWLARIVFTFNYTKKHQIQHRPFRWDRRHLHHLLHADQRVERQLLHDPRKQTVDTGQHSCCSSPAVFVFFTALMQVLHWLKVNVFKVVVLMGTFRPRPRLRRQRPRQLHRSTPRRLLLLHRLHHQRSRQQVRTAS